MYQTIQKILNGKNRAEFHDDHKLQELKQRGYIMEHPKGYLSVTREGMAFLRGEEG